MGRILEIRSNGSLRVFFVNAGEKMINPLIAQMEVVSGVETSHPVLDNPDLVHRKQGKVFISLPQAKDQFLRYFPLGFYDPRYLQEERDYKVTAHELAKTSLDPELLKSLVAKGDFAEITKNALHIMNKTNLVFPNEKMGLRDALRVGDNTKKFALALVLLLEADEKSFGKAFDDFTYCLTDIGAVKWTTATYYPFMLFPDRHMFMKPQAVQYAAELSEFLIGYRSEPNWQTYNNLLKFSVYLLDFLVAEGMNPRDMIDVQSFMWCITPGKYD